MELKLSLPDDENVEARADAEGIADLDAGRFVTGDAVKRWLRSWGTLEVLPAPRPRDTIG